MLKKTSIEQQSAEPAEEPAAPSPPPPKDETTVISTHSIVRSLRNHATMILAMTMIITFLGAGAAVGYFYLTRAYLGTSTVLFAYGYQGAADGVDPLGRPLDVGKIKSPYVIDKAIQQVDLYRTGITVEDVRSALIVEGVIPDDIMEEILIIKEIATKSPSKLEDLTELQYHPTQYVVRLRQEASLKTLSRQNMNDLLNAIIYQYRQYFIEEYSDRYLLDTIAENFDQTRYDYFEIVQILDSQINNIINYSVVMQAKSPDFRSPVTEMTFGDILANVRLIQSVNLQRLSALVHSENMSRDRHQLATLYEYNIKRMTMEMNVCIENADVARKLAEMYEKDVFVIDHLPEQDSYSQASEIYDGLLKDIFDLLSRANYLKEEIQFYKDNLRSLNSRVYVDNVAYMDFVEELIPSILTSIQDWIEVTNLTVNDYLELEAFKDATKVITPSHYRGVHMDYVRITVIICMAAFIAGLFFAILTAIWKDAFPKE